MAFAAGSRIGPYELLAPLGAGGMGEVYRAKDSKLGRDVAIKLLPELFAADPDRLARFQREAQLLASLNHPNIAAIYGLEESGGTTALVLELVPGDTLADRIAKSPIPCDEALAVAKQIAEALEAAHGQGIIHRDLKPANIKITPDGLVKVLDFGLAKLAQPAGIGSPTSPLSMSPTITSPVMTGAGALLGTAAYMSPEQAKGKEADKRSDVWAFGCVLYEMLTAKRAFDGEDVAETMAAVIRDSPDWQQLPGTTPPALHRLLRRALEKNPKRRLADIGDARIEIEDAINEPAGAPAQGQPVGAVRSLRDRVLVAAAVILFLTTLGLVVWQLTHREVDAQPVRFDIALPPGQAGTPVAEISPDGRTLAFVGPSDGKLMVWLRPMDAAAAFPLRGTEGVRERVIWSPDSKSLAFVVEGQLRRIAVTGGSPRRVANLSERSYAGSWNSQDTIILGGTQTGGGLLRVAAGGGSPEPLTTVDTARHERFHTLPRFLPDGQHYLFLAVVDDAPSVTYLGTIGTSERRALSGINAEARYVSTGHILFLRDGVLMVQRFDPGRVELAGDAVPVVDPLTRPDAITGPFSVSTTGTLVYSTAATIAVSRLSWFNRMGTELATVAPAGVHVNPELSPDGRFVAFDGGSGPTGDVFVRDLESGVETQLTTHPASDGLAHWSPDSHRIAYRSDRDGVGNIYVRSLETTTDDMPLVKNAFTKTPFDWSRDGKFLAYLQKGHIWVAPVSGEGEPTQVTFSSGTESNARFSPNVRWIAYDAGQPAGRRTVFIQSFPGGQVRKQVSVGGGVPRWNADGSELFFIAEDQYLMAVPIRATDSQLDIGTPVPLFRSFSALTVGRTYDVARDGRFLMRVPIDGQVGSPISVILNWASRLR